MYLMWNSSSRWLWSDARVPLSACPLCGLLKFLHFWQTLHDFLHSIVLQFCELAVTIGAPLSLG